MNSWIALLSFLYYVVNYTCQVPLEILKCSSFSKQAVYFWHKDKMICKDQWALCKIRHVNSLFMEQHELTVIWIILWKCLSTAENSVFQYPLFIPVPEVTLCFCHFENCNFKLPFVYHYKCSHIAPSNRFLNKKEKCCSVV